MGNRIGCLCPAAWGCSQRAADRSEPRKSDASCIHLRIKHGEGDGEGGALAGAAVYLNFAPVPVDDGPDDGKAQAAAAGLPGAGFVHPVEPLENVAQGLRGNAHAGVGYPQKGGILPDPQAYGDGAAGLVVFDAVFNQVEDDLVQVILCNEDGAVVVQLCDQRDAGPLGHGSQHPHHPPDGGGHADELAFRSLRSVYLGQGQELAATVEDKKLLRCLKFYQKHPWKRSAKKIARMLQEKRHAEVTDLLMEELKMAAANYPRRKFTDEEENQNRKTEKRASERKRELEEQGFRINIFREEPFIASRDSLQYKISLMIWEKKGKKRKVQIEEFSADRRG